MTEAQVFELLKGNNELSSLPQVLAEVIRVTDQDDSSSKELAHVIARDPALTARLLRVVNSPLYGFSHEITTINQAVITLGMRAVKAMALSTGIYRMFDDKKAVIDRMSFWRHSLETAIACRELAKTCLYRPAEEAFVVGLMHDIGILVLETNFPQQYKRIAKRVQAGEELLALEEAVWGTNHARAGKFLLEQWQLPQFMADAIGLHHTEFSRYEKDPPDRLARIIALGNMISRFRTFSLPRLDEQTMETIDALAESLGISPIALSQLQSKILNLLPKEAQFLDIQTGSVTELLEAANALISKQYFLVEKVLRDNRNMQEQIAREEAKKAGLQSLRTIAATFSHYINNASSTILGRVQLVEMAIENGTVLDTQHIAANGMERINHAVKTISLVLRELKRMPSFDTIAYSDSTAILDIEDRLKAQIKKLEKD